MPALTRTLSSRPLRSLPVITIRRSSQYNRSDFSQGFTGTVGPLSQASKSGALRLTPSLLKAHLDKFVVGQAKAKKVTSVAIYNHYQRIRELKRLELEEAARREQEARKALRERERGAHPVESESCF